MSEIIINLDDVNPLEFFGQSAHFQFAPPDEAPGGACYHSLQLSYNRRFTNGLSFGFNDTISLSDRQNTAARLDHAADGSYSIRADQAQADELLGNAIGPVHRLKGNFVWDLPDLSYGDSAATRVLAAVVNDWQVSSIFNLSSGTDYNLGFSYQNNADVLDQILLP